MDKEARKQMGPVSEHTKCVLDKMGEIEKENPGLIGNYIIEFTHFQIKEKNGFVIPFRIKAEMIAKINECNLKFSGKNLAK